MDTLLWLADMHPECKVVVVMLGSAILALLVAIGALWRNGQRAGEMQAEIIRQQGHRMDRLLARYEDA